MLTIDLPHIPTNNGAESRSGWTKIQQMYENVHHNLALDLVLLFERSRMRVRSRNSLKVLASNFQNRWRGRIRNFIRKYLCHPRVVYSFDSGYKSIDCCWVFTCRFWLVFDVLWVNFRGCCDAVWCLLEAVGDLQVVGRGLTLQFLRE